MAKKLSREELMRLSAEYWAQAKNQIMQTVQPGNARGFAHGTPRENLTFRSPFSQTQQGVSFQNGRMPNGQQIAAFVNQSGGDPYIRQLQNDTKARNVGQNNNQIQQVEPGAVMGGASGYATPATSGTMSNALAGSMVSQMAAANKANTDRYEQAVGEADALRSRRQERAVNWGNAAANDTVQQMADALKQTEASADTKGLANTEYLDSFRMRAAMNTARELNRISQNRDEMMNQMDAQDTNNKLGFVERRTDQGPDMNAYLALMEKYGATGAAGMPGAPGQLHPQAGMGAGPGGGPGVGGGRVPFGVPAPRGAANIYPTVYNYNGVTDAILGANGMGAGPGGPGIVSNRYPTSGDVRQQRAAMQQVGVAPVVPVIPGLGMGIGGALGGVIGNAAMQRPAKERKSFPKGTGNKIMAEAIKRRASKGMMMGPALASAAYNLWPGIENSFNNRK